MAAAAARAQVGIDRLPARRLSNEPRESMNCKSCRKRKIKCNRMRPTCEACSVFQCSCVYDAIPKKRGPKTDVLEALLKRVDGLEKRLQDEKRPSTVEVRESEPIKAEVEVNEEPPSQKEPSIDSAPSISNSAALFSPVESNSSQPTSTLPDALLNTFFARIHGKPYHILDEMTTRQQHHNGQLPPYLSMAIYAVSARYASSPAGYNAALRSAHDYAVAARRSVDVDEPSIDALQTLLLLSMAFYALGKGKKAYMALVHAVGIALALDLHREVSPKTKVSANEKELRRRLFWTCYMMDRFAACGSKRPALIADKPILLKLPSWIPHQGGLPVEGDFFKAVPNSQYTSEFRRKSQSSSAMLIDIVRILGVTNRYLANGGVKGDSHFPWHTLSNLSKIRSELDVWATGTQDILSSIDNLFGQPESTTLLLSKMVYHLIHCLIYRPFLPIDLAELRGTGQHQSWQIEATNLCFLHANAISELCELGRSSTMIEWPAFIGYCICTVGTVHVHGVYYRGLEGEIFASSADFLAREMQQLAWLRWLWAGFQHQREMLQNIYSAHADLVKSLSTNALRYSPVFHLEDFFDRYPGRVFDGTHISFVDVAVEDIFENGAMPHDRDRAGILPSQSRSMAPPVTSAQQAAQVISSTSGPSMPGRSASFSNQSMNGQSTNTKQRRPSAIRRNTADKVSKPAQTPFSHFSNLPTKPAHQAPHFQQAVQDALPTTSVNPSRQFELFPPLPERPLAMTADLPYMGSPTPFSFSPAAFPDGMFNIAPTPPPNLQGATFSFDASQMQQNQNTNGGSALTPGAHSQTSGSHAMTASDSGAGEKDPFLNLLEQLAENEQSAGGPSGLDFFLSGMGSTVDSENLMMGGENEGDAQAGTEREEGMGDGESNARPSERSAEEETGVGNEALEE